MIMLDVASRTEPELGVSADFFTLRDEMGTA